MVKTSYIHRNLWTMTTSDTMNVLRTVDCAWICLILSAVSFHSDMSLVSWGGASRFCCANLQHQTDTMKSDMKSSSYLWYFHMQSICNIFISVVHWIAHSSFIIFCWLHVCRVTFTVDHGTKYMAQNYTLFKKHLVRLMYYSFWIIFSQHLLQLNKQKY